MTDDQTLFFKLNPITYTPKVDEATNQNLEDNPDREHYGLIMEEVAERSAGISGWRFQHRRNV